MRRQVRIFAGVAVALICLGVWFDTQADARLRRPRYLRRPPVDAAVSAQEAQR